MRRSHCLHGFFNGPQMSRMCESCMFTGLCSLLYSHVPIILFVINLGVGFPTNLSVYTGVYGWHVLSKTKQRKKCVLHDGWFYRFIRQRTKNKKHKFSTGTITNDPCTHTLQNTSSINTVRETVRSCDSPVIHPVPNHRALNSYLLKETGAYGFLLHWN